jgi:hypothetical protein
MFSGELDCIDNSKAVDSSLWSNDSAARSCSAVIAAVVSSTLGTLRERVLRFFLVKILLIVLHFAKRLEKVFWEL